MKDENVDEIYPCIMEEELEDTKGVIRIRISKKNRQHNGEYVFHSRIQDVWSSLQVCVRNGGEGGCYPIIVMLKHALLSMNVISREKNNIITLLFMIIMVSPYYILPEQAFFQLIWYSWSEVTTDYFMEMNSSIF